MITTQKADITDLHVDAIVNAANTALAPGGGVCGAIHRKAGPDLAAECRTLGACVTGDAKMTAGYKLPALYVIHAVGPVWHGGGQGEADLLANCYRKSLDLANAKGLQSIAFPAISTGIFGYPIRDAATVAVKAINQWLADHPDSISDVRLVCFSDEDEAAYAAAIAENRH
ncbi:MAG: O-acetyl-ADP-ribose deacetylase [Alphaproteobacteria bacterium]|nr:O-acetyl-ADP-ribose deacetylase [Alphaproteobacteria bacterium]